MEKFTLTEEHIKLAQRMYIDWNDCGDGAPEVDCKRPYGNSDVEHDICEILGFETKYRIDGEGRYNDEDYKYAQKIHLEMGTALQLILKFKTFEPGKFEREDIWGEWEAEK